VRESSSSGPNGSLAIVGGRVWDATGNPARDGVDVWIRDGRISAIGRLLDIPASAPRIDARGHFVMPGLIDMHVHVMLCGGEQSLPAFLGAGVTSVRDLGSDPDVTLPLRDRLASGTLAGPRLFVYGPMLDGDPPIFGRRASQSPITRVCTDANAGCAAVAELLERKVDGIKLYAGLRPPLVEAMTRAVARRVPVAAHLGRTWASEAIDAGVDTLEHVHATLYQDVALPEDRHPREGGNGVRPDYWSWLSLGWSRVDLGADYVARFIDRIVTAGVVVSPTTVLCTGGMATREAADEPGQAYRPRAMRQRVELRRPALERTRATSIPSLDPQVGRRARDNELEFLRRLHRAGGRIVPGTDVGAAPLQVPGFSMHRELALLVEGGIPATEVLEAATREAARTLRALPSLGTVEVGKYADLLVIDGDPLSDIHATRQITYVIQGGRPHEAKALLEAVPV